jgi:glyoxylase-like metal-dependent hydrolase (beta-lactamase superfamily II)
MRYCKNYQFNGGIRAIRLGWSLAGPPLMTVYCYIFDHTMIDTGQSHMQKEVLTIAGENDVRQVFLTHHHEDHSGNAAAIRKYLDADVYGHRFTVEKLKAPYPILPYQKYIWGKSTPLDVKEFPDEPLTSLGRIVPVFTPGHAKDHTVFFLPERGILFSGDLYLADRIKFFRSDEDMGTQIESLKTVAGLDFDTLLCAHNPKPAKGRNHIRNKLEFLENLYGAIISFYEKGLPEKQIFKQLKLREAYLTKYICFGNVSMRNGVRSAIRHYEHQADAKTKGGKNDQGLLSKIETL